MNIALFLLTTTALWPAGAVKQLPPKCLACNDIATNFQRWIEKTAGSNFGGGNTDWEKKSLGNYEHSETRLTEILEHVCQVSSSADRCHSMLEDQESAFEDWWFNDFAKGRNLDIHQWLCVDKLAVCCPANRFGPTCQLCPVDDKDQACSGHGYCDGIGSRTGTGNCDCEKGYSGTSCSRCKSGFYSVPTDKSFDCRICSSECKNCSGPGASRCLSCAKGFQSDQTDADGNEITCADVDECLSGEHRCDPNRQFCENTVGSFACRDCDGACAGCTGPRPTDCLTCAGGFRQGPVGGQHDGPENSAGTVHCVDVDECAEAGQSALCEDGTFCLNVAGSYECAACNRACSRCTDATNRGCLACADGFRPADNGSESTGHGQPFSCVDVDECAERLVECNRGKFCANSPGSAHCITCDVSCLGCFASGPEGCLQCQKGYRFEQQTGVQTCVDVDECKAASAENRQICHGQNERCVNFAGGYSCDCLAGYRRRQEDRQCVKDTTKRPAQQPNQLDLGDMEFDPKTGEPMTGSKKQRAKSRKAPFATSYHDLAVFGLSLVACAVCSRLAGAKRTGLQVLIVSSLTAFIWYFIGSLEHSKPAGKS